MQGVEDTVVVLEAARQCRDRAEYERTVLEHFERSWGYEVALFLSPRGPGPVTPGFHPSLRARLMDSLPVLQRELAPLERAALAAGGVGVETDVFTPRELERTHYYREVLRPAGEMSSMLGYFVCRSGPVGAIVFGRRRERGFSEADRKRLASALPALTVAELAVKLVAPPPTSAEMLRALTPREREVISYLRRGLTNREIAKACGTSYRTVRNQLSAAYAKLGVSNRTEALALAIDLE